MYMILYYTGVGITLAVGADQFDLGTGQIIELAVLMVGLGIIYGRLTSGQKALAAQVSAIEARLVRGEAEFKQLGTRLTRIEERCDIMYGETPQMSIRKNINGTQP